MRLNVACAAVALVTLAGCASYTKMAPDDRARIEREMSGRDSAKYLKLSYYVTPFFGDASKKLLTPVPPDEVFLLDNPNGSPVSPGPIEKVIPAGRKVRVVKVEFPTSFVVMERIPYTPRQQPWVYVEVEDEAKTQTFILPLSRAVDTREKFANEIGRYLSDQDPAQQMGAWSDGIREAIRTKTALVDMTPQALEMAWGYPELIRKDRDGASLKEQWVYPGHKRIAHLVDGRLVRTEGN